MTLGYVFSLHTSVFPVSTPPPILHTNNHPHAALITNANRRSLTPFEKLHTFDNLEALCRKVLSLFTHERVNYITSNDTHSPD
jgi:hypothetical protein